MSFAVAKNLGAAPALIVLSLSWLAVTLLERWQCYRQARRERSQLLSLGERDLHDIGISRIDALRIANKPLWQGCGQSEPRRAPL